MEALSPFVIAACALALVVGVPLVRTVRRESAEASPLAQAVLTVLPGANCGMCGCDSCFEAAAKVASGRAPSSICVAGGVLTTRDVAAVMRANTFHQVR